MTAQPSLTSSASSSEVVSAVVQAAAPAAPAPSLSSATRCPQLTWRDRSGEQRVVSLSPSKRTTIVFGTAIGKVDIVLDDPSISPIHAEIEVAEDGSFWARDLGSEHGTFVESVEVKSARVRPGQSIRFGNLLVDFQSGDSDCSEIVEVDVSSFTVRVPPHMLEFSHRQFRERWADIGERFFLTKKLAKHSRNVSRVSREIELARTYTHKLIKKYGL